MFLRLWYLYLIQRALKDCPHPFAFVTEKGAPYSEDSFAKAHVRAVRRIGLIPAKMMGTSPHGHRHGYGQRLADAKIDPIFRKKALHHLSLESQTVYTEPGVAKVTKVLNEASARLEEGKAMPPPDFLGFGFEDFDPTGLFSGPNPSLKGN